MLCTFAGLSFGTMTTSRFLAKISGSPATRPSSTAVSISSSAAEEEMDTAVDDGLVAGEPEIFARNREVVMVPKDNPANVQSMRDLAKPGMRLVLAEGGVPAADYALEILGRANAEYGG